MNYSLYKVDQYKQLPWSGGNTTELFIFPEKSSYAARDFLIRISTASIVAHDSVFTLLPGLQRQLMMLEGALLISHKEKHTALLLPLEPYSFDGSWHTESKGTGVDYNLMTSAKVQGKLSAIDLLPGSRVPFTTIGLMFIHLFVHDGSMKIDAEGSTIEVTKGMSVVIEHCEGTFFLSSTATCTVIATTVIEN